MASLDEISGSDAGGADLVQVRLLGSVDVTVGGVARPVSGLRRKGVLAVLGLAAGEVVSADRLIDIVWGDDAPATVANALQSNVSYLRGVLGSRSAIVAREQGYLLDLGPEATDLRVAERLIRQSRQAPDPAAGAACLREALALWRGEPLADVAGLPWLRAQAQRLADLRLQAVHGLVEARLALGEHAQLLPELERLSQQHPFDEHLHGQLMIALYRSGRQADALMAYRRLREQLGEELGIDPGPRLRELEAAILRQDDALRPRPVATRPSAAATAGERQDAGATAGERPGAGATAGGPPAPAQLPGTADGFVGRDAQLAQLDSVLGSVLDSALDSGLGAASPSGGAPGLTIAVIGGTAGVGKTSLAVHWAHRARHHFPGGQLYLNLRGYATSPPVEPVQALAQFLRALGVAAERVPLDVDEAAAMYRTLLADRRMLIVLDNAASPDQVRPLLPGGRGCLVLVTSRDRLGGLVASDGARPLALDVLGGGEAHALLTEVLGERRAGAEPHAVAELARVCGFLPLALRIAAANLVLRPGIAVAAYVAELREGNRLAALQVDGDENAAVRTAFDRSYGALKPDERRVFRLLGLVPGPDVDTAAVAALTAAREWQGAPERPFPLTSRWAGSVLARLVGRHLVTEVAPGRFTLHDLLRLYARSLADAEDGPPETAAAMDRLCAHYLDATDAAAGLLYRETLRWPVPRATPGERPFADHTQALRWLDTERANLVALVRHTAEHGPRPAAWRLADNLRGYFYLRRHVGDWLTVAGDGLRAARGQPGPQAAARLSLGSAHNSLGDSAAALEDYTEALALAERAGWSDGQAAALNNLGTVYSQTGRHRQAAQRFEQAAAAHERAGRLVGQAISLDNLGIVRRELGEPGTAAALHERAIELHRRTGFPLGHATALTNLAAACCELGRLDDALWHFTQALALHRQTGNRDRETISLYGMADVHRSAGRLAEAVRPAREALDLAKEIGDRRTEASAAMSLAAVEAAIGEHRSALDRYRHALHLAEQTDSRYLRARALAGVAAAELRLGNPAEAEAAAAQALDLSRDNGYHPIEAEVSATLAALPGP